MFLHFSHPSGFFLHPSLVLWNTLVLESSEPLTCTPPWPQNRERVSQKIFREWKSANCFRFHNSQSTPVWLTSYFLEKVNKVGTFQIKWNVLSPNWVSSIKTRRNMSHCYRILFPFHLWWSCKLSSPLTQPPHLEGRKRRKYTKGNKRLMCFDVLISAGLHHPLYPFHAHSNLDVQDLTLLTFLKFPPSLSFQWVYFAMNPPSSLYPFAGRVLLLSSE